MSKFSLFSKCERNIKEILRLTDIMNIRGKIHLSKDIVYKTIYSNICQYGNGNLLVSQENDYLYYDVYETNIPKIIYNHQPFPYLYNIIYEEVTYMIDYEVDITIDISINKRKYLSNKDSILDNDNINKEIFGSDSDIIVPCLLLEKTNIENPISNIYTKYNERMKGSLLLRSQELKEYEGQIYNGKTKDSAIMPIRIKDENYPGELIYMTIKVDIDK